MIIISIQLFSIFSILHFQVDYLYLCSIFGVIGIKFQFWSIE